MSTYDNSFYKNIYQSIKLNSLFSVDTIKALNNISDLLRQVSVHTDNFKYITSTLSFINLSVKPELIKQIYDMSNFLTPLYQQISRISKNFHIPMSELSRQLSQAAAWSSLINPKLMGLNEAIMKVGLNKVNREISDKQFSFDQLSIYGLYSLTKSEEFEGLNISSEGATATGGQTLSLFQIQEAVEIDLENSGIFNEQESLTDAINNLIDSVHKQNSAVKQIVISIIAGLILFLMQPFIQPCQDFVNSIRKNKNIVRTVKQEIKNNPDYDSMREIRGYD